MRRALSLELAVKQTSPKHEPENGWIVSRKECFKHKALLLQQPSEELQSEKRKYRTDA